MRNVVPFRLKQPPRPMQPRLYRVRPASRSTPLPDGVEWDPDRDPAKTSLEIKRLTDGKIQVLVMERDWQDSDEYAGPIFIAAQRFDDDETMQEAEEPTDPNVIRAAREELRVFRESFEDSAPSWQPKTPVEIEIVIASSLAGKPVPEQEWHVEGLIPAHNVTLLAGDGATGKSLLGLQLAAATATGCSWIGLHTKPGKALFVSAEDEIEEIHRRLARMCRHLKKLDNLSIVPLAGKDAILAAPEGGSGLLKETPLFKALRDIIAKHRPDLLVLDTLADLFGGDEIKKVQARQFIAMLRGLALEYRVTVLLLSHPSQSGMNSGAGTSGNVAWNNSVRSRLYLERRIVDGSEDDGNIRVLRTMKANRAASGGQIVLRYDEGLFVREQESALNARDAAHQAECAFMDLLAQFEREGRTVSDKPGANYAPLIFSKSRSKKFGFMNKALCASGV